MYYAERLKGATSFNSLFLAMFCLLLPLANHAGAAQDCVSLTSGMVAWYHGDGNAADSVWPPANPAQELVGFSSGLIDRAFDFNGAESRVIVADTQKLRFARQMSVEAWIRPRTISQDRYHEIVSRWNTFDYSYTLTLRPTGQAAFNICSDGRGYRIVTVDSTSTIPVGQWTHLAVTYDNATVRMYVNGVLEGSRAWTNGIWPGQSQLYIGTTASAPSFYDGQIDELSLYERALTDAEVSNIYTQGANGKCAILGTFPNVVIMGETVTNNAAQYRGPVLVNLVPNLDHHVVFFTLDNSDPKNSGRLYSAPFWLTTNALIRVVAFSGDFSSSVERSALNVSILPLVSIKANGGGVVQMHPQSGPYLPGNMVELSANPQPGWQFLHWLGDASGTNTTVSLRVDHSMAAEAVFGTPLRTSTVGSGAVKVDPIASAYPFGQKVRLTALPAEGNYFAYWANVGANSKQNPLELTISQTNPLVTAVFSSLGSSKSNTLTVQIEGNGQVLRSASGNLFSGYTNVVLTAVPSPGQRFIEWLPSGGTDSSLVLQMNVHRLVTAVFSASPTLELRRSTFWDAPRSLSLRLESPFGSDILILQSTNMIDWQPVAEITNTWGKTHLPLEMDANASAKFFRATER